MKPVRVKRLVVSGTVEQRILALQKAKQGLADAALGEGGVPKIPKRMHVNDIKMVNLRLFPA
jgi:SNF2 family DNA or RNA helicase